VLTVTGFGTVVALIGSKLAMGKFIPLYYGSSFSYIAAVTAITKAEFGVPADPALLSIVQTGFIATGVINIIVGLIIRYSGGKEALDKVLPPIVTGPVATTIGIGLGASALQMASGVAGGIMTGDLKWWAAAIIT
jgi:uracil permease